MLWLRLPSWLEIVLAQLLDCKYSIWHRFHMSLSLTAELLKNQMFQLVLSEDGFNLTILTLKVSVYRGFCEGWSFFVGQGGRAVNWASCPTTNRWCGLYSRHLRRCRQREVLKHSAHLSIISHSTLRYQHPEAWDWGGGCFAGGVISLLWWTESLAACLGVFSGVLGEEVESTSSLLENRLALLLFQCEKNQTH